MIKLDQLELLQACGDVINIERQPNRVIFTVVVTDYSASVDLVYSKIHIEVTCQISGDKLILNKAQCIRVGNITEIPDEWTVENLEESLSFLIQEREFQKREKESPESQLQPFVDISPVLLKIQEDIESYFSITNNRTKGPNLPEYLALVGQVWEVVESKNRK